MRIVNTKIQMYERCNPHVLVERGGDVALEPIMSCLNCGEFESDEEREERLKRVAEVTIRQQTWWLNKREQEKQCRLNP